MIPALACSVPRPSGPGNNDAEVTHWALAARGGDPVAVERFVRATYSDVWRFVAHLSGDTHGADDLAQDAFLRALHNLPQFAGRSGVRTWLMSIARRSVIDRYRHASARPQVAETADWRAAAENTQPFGLPGFEEGVALLDLLDGLDAARREAFVLTQLLGLSYADAASAAGCPIGTVRSRVARAREDLSALLRAAERSGEPGHRQPEFASPVDGRRAAPSGSRLVPEIRNS
ncbi:sigma-70 family RNA polymerase sigma factor [Streptomyces sp. AK04-3B]|uniref:sigma-70 family RNA polymerase sigma factor n=1 Tax=Streptomyces sp. AK04-3B TaxID=3028650 RepID=UPI0029B09239|nr:sigma-70 family RNA polymerase sigma factor [Streptomyces sp. AK04-3B]MDX3802049.1 sigma-70 family RNA polymerase sigma factor [Streptomyces sp. AK04-3B]